MVPTFLGEGPKGIALLLIHKKGKRKEASFIFTLEGGLSRHSGTRKVSQLTASIQTLRSRHAHAHAHAHAHVGTWSQAHLERSHDCWETGELG